MTRYYEHISSVKNEGTHISRYDWIGGSRDYQGYLIISDFKLSFYFDQKVNDTKLEEILQPYPKSNFLTIYIHNPEAAYRQIIDMFTREHKDSKGSKVSAENYYPRIESIIKVKSNYIYRDMLLDFIWNLFYRNNFEETKQMRLLKSFILSDKLLSGIKHKLFYSEYILRHDPYDIERRANKSVTPFILKTLNDKLENEYIINYWIYLLDDKNEVFMSPKEGWFKSREEELNTVLDSIYTKKLQNVEDLETLSFKLSVKRRSFKLIRKILSHGEHWRQKLKNSIPDIFLPRLVMGIMFGWVLIITDGEKFKMFNEEDRVSLSHHLLSHFSLLLLILGVFLFIFLYRESRKVAPSEDRKKIIGRNIIITIFGFSYSWLVCKVIVSFKIIHLNNHCDAIGLSLMAFYIGFFFQLLLQDKSTTESL